MTTANGIEGAVENGLGRVEDGVGGLTGDVGLQAKGKARQLKGKADQALGKVEAVVSRTFGDPAAQQVRDKAEAAIGAVQDSYERVRDTAKDRVDQRLADEPYKTLGMAAVAGVLIGMLLGRRGRRVIYLPKQ